MTLTIQIANGHKFHPLDPCPDDLFIEDIAASLAKLCRFNGACLTFYSVAEHAVRVSWAVEEMGGDRDEVRWSLHHDDPEFIVGDLNSEIKHNSGMGLEFSALEDEIMRAVCARFGLPFVEPPIVKLADLTLLATEKRDLMLDSDEVEWGDLPQPLPDAIEPWPWQRAREMYLARFRELA